MPYIGEDGRKALDNAINSIVDQLVAWYPSTYWVGALNYVVFTIVKRFFDRVPPRYHLFAHVTGTLQCCIHEMYRRLVAPYEDKAIDKNGDIR